MIDIATIKDPTTTEEHKKRMDEVIKENNNAPVADNISAVLEGITQSNMAENRLRIIEEKLDLILEILEERR